MLTRKEKKVLDLKNGQNDNQTEKLLHRLYHFKPVVHVVRLELDPLKYKILSPILPSRDGPFRRTRLQRKRDAQLFNLEPRVVLKPLAVQQASNHSFSPVSKCETRRTTRSSSKTRLQQSKTVKKATQSLQKLTKPLGRWTKAELKRLSFAVTQISTAESNYWESVARIVKSRNADDCCHTFNENSDLQKAAHQEKVFQDLVALPSFGDKPQTKLEAPSQPQEKFRRVITAAAGTLKRRQQIRAIVQQDAANHWDKSDRDTLSIDGAGLTTSERNALIGNLNISPSASQGGGGNMSVMTAGGAGLSLHSESNLSLISSAFEVPSSANRKDADKLVKKMRSYGGKKKKGQATPARKPCKTMAKKALAFDRLLPMASNLAAMSSTPYVSINKGCGKRAESASPSTLAATDSDSEAIA